MPRNGRGLALRVWKAKVRVECRGRRRDEGRLRNPAQADSQSEANGSQSRS